MYVLVSQCWSSRMSLHEDAMMYPAEEAMTAWTDDTNLADTITASLSLHRNAGNDFKHCLDKRKSPGKNTEPAARTDSIVPVSEAGSSMGNQILEIRHSVLYRASGKSSQRPVVNLVQPRDVDKDVPGLSASMLRMFMWPLQYLQRSTDKLTLACSRSDRNICKLLTMSTEDQPFLPDMRLMYCYEISFQSSSIVR